MSINSLADQYRAAVFGATGGLGAAFVEALSDDPRCARVYVGGRDRPLAGHCKVRPFAFDLLDEPSIEASVRDITRDGPLQLVIVATGLLHDERLKPEKTWRAVTAENLQRSFATNAVGPMLIAKHVLAHLAKSEKSVFATLSARVGSISDNRLGGWHAYRASKAALNMLIRNAAIELERTNPSAICVGLHPGTVDTRLSAPFQGGLPDSQILDTRTSARHLLSVIDDLSASDTGRVYDWKGEEIPS